MIHADDHDPILGDEWSSQAHRGDHCAACLAARNSTFAQLRKVVPGLGPGDPSEFIRRMQEIADAHVRVLVGPYDWQAAGDFGA